MAGFLPFVGVAIRIENLITIVFAVLAFVAGLGLIFVRVDRQQLGGLSHSMPGLALFRYGAVRYGGAILCFAVSALAAASCSGYI